MTTATGAASIVAIVPAYNEGKRVRGVVEGAAVHLPVWVVDDGSSDDTVSTAEAAGARVIRQPRNMGKGEALKAGFKAALAAGAEAVVALDADGQHDPEEIPRFLSLWQETHADLIIGARDFAQMPPLRRVGNRLGSAIFSWAIGTHIPDNQSGYRLVSHHLMDAMLDAEEGGFEFEVEMIVVCRERGHRLEWIPIRTIYEGEKSHIHPLRHVVSFMRVIARTRRRTRERRLGRDRPQSQDESMSA